MKKILLALGVIALSVSCQKGILSSGHLYDDGVVVFDADASGEIPAFLEESGPVSFTFSSSVKVDEDVTVSFEPVRDTTVLAAFNKAGGTNYWFLPESNCSLASKSTVIKAGNAISEPVTLDVDIDGLKNGVIYCLPFKINGTSSDITTIPGEEYAFVVIRGYVYASVAHLTGGYFSMPTTVNDPRLHMDYCTMEIRFKAESWQSANPFISTLIGTEESFLLRIGDVSIQGDNATKMSTLNLAGGNGIGATKASSNRMELDKWYHVAAVVDGLGQTATVYVNGEEDFSVPIKSQGLDLGLIYNSVFSIGMSVNGRLLRGYVSEARVWGRLLSKTELVNGQCAIADPVAEARDNKLLGYWKLDAENGAKDLTGNGFDGIKYGSVSYTEANVRCPE
jgi:hypothetical protein